LLPWHIVAFLVLLGLRSVGLVPLAALQPISAVTNLLTVIAMAALGLVPKFEGSCAPVRESPPPSRVHCWCWARSALV
jgi:uncharacterized membrane protein YadS